MFDLNIAWYRVIADDDVPVWIIVVFHNGCAVEYAPGSVGQPGMIYSPARVVIESRRTVLSAKAVDSPTCP